MRQSIRALCDESAWTPWQPLKKSWLGTALPACPGLYRIRLVDREMEQIAYIGQSGEGLRSRVYALRHIYKEEMPYKAPHTAGPGLWALRHKYPTLSFEISVAPLPTVPDVLRLGLECLAVALVRQNTRSSPLCQFGRMPDGYAPSSGNDKRLVLAGKRFRGGTTTLALDCHLPGIEPQGSLESNQPHSREWCGHHWTPWIAMHSLNPVGEEGLYRLRIADLDPLVFLGHGKLVDRLKSIQPLEHMECSWVSDPAWYSHQRLELLTDLIAAHLLSTATLPLWQFEPSHDDPGGEPLVKAS
ncbi:MAG: hypothetical protein H0U76_22325 [Ktedonobacteraceae bacterium]|nr:hypothetical protein [Ktedonobacteraceae bacterium]